MTKVFIVQEVMARNRESKSVRPAHDFTAAVKYGELTVLLPHSVLPLQLDNIVSILNEKLKNITKEDYLILVGDPVAMAITASIVSKNTGGKLRILKWDRKYKVYVPNTADIGE